jgi:hypothetical protein
MKISEMIKELEEMKERFGDVSVEIRNEVGSWVDANKVESCVMNEIVYIED